MLLAADATSGVSQMRFANEDGVWSNWEPYATSKPWNLTAGDGAKTVYVQYSDLANLTVTSYQTIMLDMTKPVPNAGQNQTVIVGMSVTLNGTASSDNTGIASYIWDFGDGTNGMGPTPIHNYTNIGTYVAKLTVVDLAGNRETSSSTVSIEVVIPEFSTVVLFAFAIMLSSVAIVGRSRLKN
jgi:predicted secreted protein with PEFG-CTERM motif